MINAESRSEYTFEAMSNLCGQRYFGQQIKHLFASLQRVFDKMNINFGLSARSDPLEQTHVLVLEARIYFFVGFLLVFVQLVARRNIAVCRRVQATYILNVCFENMFVNQV